MVQQDLTRAVKASDEFDYVVVGGPPVNLYADAVLLGKLTDGWSRSGGASQFHPPRNCSQGQGKLGICEGEALRGRVE
jgi:hypothetical protein